MGKKQIHINALSKKYSTKYNSKFSQHGVILHKECVICKAKFLSFL